MLWHLRIHLCIWVRQLPTALTLKLKSSADTLPLWRQQSISRTTKMRIYNAAVLSVLLYSTETWPLTGTLSSRLDGFDSRALRSIIGIHWRDLVSNETVQALAGQPPASSLAARHQVLWYGHVLRLPPHHPSRDILDFDPGLFSWKRPRRAPTHPLVRCGQTRSWSARPRSSCSWTPRTGPW